MFEEETVHLLGTSSRLKGRRNGRSHDKMEGDQLLHLSDSELSTSKKQKNVEAETAMFSDSLYGDSLPSMRAQLAASQMQYRRRGAPDAGERESSLHTSGKESPIAGAIDDSLKKTIAREYDSIGDQKSKVTRKRPRRDWAIL